MTPHIIAITGGIGAGKSVVAKIVRALGYPVFDCDSEAKALMDADNSIKERLACEIDTEVIVDGSIDRARLAAIVFADKAKLATLNAIVHGAVKQKLSSWVAAAVVPVVFVETAILFQSGLNRIVDAEWRVEAPEDIRVARVMTRNGMNRQQVLDRIKAQSYIPPSEEPAPPLSIIVNDGITPLLQQTVKLLQQK